jgi:hypothetical protein
MKTARRAKNLSASELAVLGSHSHSLRLPDGPDTVYV